MVECSSTVSAADGGGGGNRGSLARAPSVRWPPRNAGLVQIRCVPGA